MCSKFQRNNTSNSNALKEREGRYAIHRHLPTQIKLLKCSDEILLIVALFRGTLKNLGCNLFAKKKNKRQRYLTWFWKRLLFWTYSQFIETLDISWRISKNSFFSVDLRLALHLFYYYHYYYCYYYYYYYSQIIHEIYAVSSYIPTLFTKFN